MTAETGTDALADALAEDEAIAASHDALLAGNGPTDRAVSDGAKPRPVPLAEMQARGNKIFVGDKTYHVSPLLFGRLAELQELCNALPLILYGAVLAEPSEQSAEAHSVDKAALIELMVKWTEDSTYSEKDAQSDFRKLALQMNDAVKQKVADIILVGVQAKHPDATAADYLPYLSVPSSIAAIRAVLGGAVGDFFGG